MYNLSNFTLRDMLVSGGDIRRVTKTAKSMEEAAESIVHYLYERCADPNSGSKGLALVRCYKTHPYGALDITLRRFADAQMEGVRPSPSMKCLTLLATVGEQPAWNSRHTSSGHKAIPLPSVAVIEQAPMIAQLIRQMGIEINDLVAPDRDTIKGQDGKTYNVFHVEQAKGSPSIPAQKEFVERYNVQSVLGFGGLLRTGDLFAIIMFAKQHIPSDSAQRFKTLALDAKAAFFPYTIDQVFANRA
jgi:hypothetical protein